MSEDLVAFPRPLGPRRRPAAPLQPPRHVARVRHHPAQGHPLLLPRLGSTTSTAPSSRCRRSPRTAGSPRPSITGPIRRSSATGWCSPTWGRPEEKPEFPDYDTYHRPDGNKLLPMSIFSPCNWLQVCENIMDHLHVGTLHNPQMMTVEGVNASEIEGMDYAAPMASPSGRRSIGNRPAAETACASSPAGAIPTSGTVWVRIVETIFPNYLQIGCTFPSARTSRRSQTVWTRWHVPVDDENMLVLGWRHFNDEVDPLRLGKEEEVGYEKLDFLGGVVGNRTYEEGQRAPGDYEALIGQRAIAIHDYENPGSADAGVYMCRKLLRECVRGNTPPHESLEINGKREEQAPHLHPGFRDERAFRAGQGRSGVDASRGPAGLRDHAGRRRRPPAPTARSTSALASTTWTVAISRRRNRRRAPDRGHVGG